MKLMTLTEFSTLLGISKTLETLILTSRGGTSNQLNYEWAKTKSYLTTHCNKKNDCPDANYDTDCTHFVCHALNKGKVFIANPSVSCTQGLGINARELATSFKNSVGKYQNVKSIAKLEDTREGDFAFIPSWFGLDYDHAMVLASPITKIGGQLGSKRWQHSVSRCGDEWAAFGDDVVVFRIE